MTPEEWELGRRYFDSLPKASAGKTFSWNLRHISTVSVHASILCYLFSRFLGMGHECETDTTKAMICQAMLCLYMSIANGVSWEVVIIPLNAVSGLNDACVGVGQRRQATHIDSRAWGDANPSFKPTHQGGNTRLQKHSVQFACRGPITSRNQL